MKILVDRDKIRKIFEAAKQVGIYSLEKNTIEKTSDIVRVCSDILKANPVEFDGYSWEKVTPDELADNDEITDDHRQWAERKIDTHQLQRDIDWCESRLQDHDAALIEILDMLSVYAYSQDAFKADRLQRDIDTLKAKLVGER